MPYKKEHECQRCDKLFTAYSHNTRRCVPCRKKVENDRRRRSPLPQTCDICEDEFKPYKSGVKYCGPKCAREASNRKRTPERDDQMERLFRYYKSRESVTIDEAKDGDRVLVLSDTQFPFSDIKLLETIDRFIEDWKPTDIFYNGDITDCYEISDFDRRPERLFNLQDEFEMTADWTARHRRLTKCRQWWVDGNHEERMNRTIWRKAQGFSFMVADIAEALELEKWTKGFVPYGKHFDYLGFIITHGTIVRKNAGYTARAMMEKYRSSGVSGHTHRAGSHSMTDHRERSHTWYEQGCLCRLDLDYLKAHPDWQHAFVLGTVYGGALHPQLVRVVETKRGRGFVAAGTYYKIPA